MINSPSFLGYTRLGAETTATKTDLREVRLFPFKIYYSSRTLMFRSF